LAQKIRVGAVSYLNTKPLIFGFQQGEMKDKMELIIDYPANIAAFLINDQIDVGLVPVAIIPLLKEHHVIADYGIACDGEVASVCLFSDVPLEEIKSIYLDYQSRTSVELLKILLKEHWKISPELITGTQKFENEIKGTTAGLVIGDRAFTQRLKSKYMYDLGLAWKEMTGMPFVFAAWISNKKLPEDFIAKFNEANLLGLKNLDEVITQNPYSNFDMKAYYTENIKFNLEPGMFTAMDMFLSKLQRNAEAIS
jgi:chorismate dehydratase